MPRLPTPGGDAENWGGILNDFLRQIHAEDGQLKTSSVTTPTISNGAVSESKLTQGVKDKLNALASVTGGREIELQSNSTHIQWRYTTEATWTNLVALSDITGIQGLAGPKGDKGDAGDPGVTSWADVTDKPNVFPSEAHNHVMVDVVGLQDELAGKVPATRTIAGKALVADVTLEAADVGAERVKLLASSNLFDRQAVTPGTVISAGTADLSVNSQYSVSDSIPVTPGGSYTYVYALRVTYLNATGSYVSFHTVSSYSARTYVVPAGATRVRLSVPTLYIAMAQMNIGNAQLPYEDGSRIPATAVDLSAIPRVDQSTNLLNLDPVTISPKSAISTVTGGIVPHGGGTFIVSNWVPADGGESYSVGSDTAESIRWAQYDANRMFISTGLSATFTTAKDARWVRIQVHNDSVTTARLNRGATLLPWETYWVSVGGARIPFLPASLGSIESVNRYILDDPAGLDHLYTAPTISEQPALVSTVTNDVHGWYDALLAAHPTYLTRTNLGMSSDGVHSLFSYRLAPPPVPTNAYITPFPKVLLFSGVHGYEKAGVFNLYQLAKQLCEVSGNPVIDALRANFEFYIVPVGNPYGYNISVRKNAGGVDIARNFTEGWALGDPASTTYGGEVPLSEPESIILDNLMNTHRDQTVLGLSFHNFSTGVESPGTFIWNAAATQLQLNIGKRLISRMTRVWKTYPAVTDTSDYFGYSDRDAPAGSESLQFRRYGIHGATFEVSNWSRLSEGSALHDSQSMTLGLEASVNYLAISLREHLKTVS